MAESGTPHDRQASGSAACGGDPSIPPLVAVACSLAEAVGAEQIAQRVVEGALELTSARGAYIERLVSSQRVVEVVAAAGRDAPPAGATGPAPGTPTDLLIRGGEAVRFGGRGGDAHAAVPAPSYLAECCDPCAGLALPMVAEGEVIGALILLHDPGATGLTPAEESQARLLGQFASLALRAALRLEATERERSHMRTLLESTGQGIYGVDREGRCTFINPAAARMLGYTAEECLGQDIHQLVHHSRPDGSPYAAAECPLVRALRLGESVGLDEEILWRKDGSGIPVERTAYPLIDGGEVAGAVVSFIDISAWKRVQDERERARTEAAETARQLSAVLGQIAEGVIFADARGTILFVNEAAQQLHGTAELRVPLEEYSRAFRLLTTTDQPYPPEQLPLARAVRSGEAVMDVEWKIRRPDGATVVARGSAVPVRDADGTLLGAVLTILDITERKRAEALQRGQQRVLEMIARGAPISDVLESILRVMEELSPGMLGSILVLDPDGVHLHHGAAPSLPAEYNRTIDGIEIGPDVGSCGTAAFSGEPVMVTDIATDPRWEAFREPAARAGLRASWSTPIRSAHGSVLGTFAMYYREPRVPTLQDRQLIDTATYLAGIALERERAETERRRLLEEAHTARREAEAANRAKSEFLATMSHEIRTPINAITGYAELLEMGISGPVTDAQKAQLLRLKASSEHLLGLVDDVLDLAKIEARRTTVQHERMRVADTVAAALTVVAPQAAKHDIAIEDPCADDRATFYVGDEERVRQILVNLLSNAVKFTEPGGRVTVTCGIQHEPDEDTDLSLEGPWTYIRVADTGIGIAPDMLEQIFHPFEQVESGHTRTRGGTGLGLTISRELARLMGGDLTVVSEPGEGSAFTLWLPSLTTTMAPVDETVLAEVRGRSRPPRGLAAVGETLQTHASAVLERFTQRLREDPQVQSANLDQADLEDHAAPFLSDLGQALIVLERSQAVPARILRDGSEIQRLISELHGRQRAQLRWSEAALCREFEILWEQIAETIRRHAPADVEVDEALSVLRRFVDRAQRTSVLAWRRAVAASVASSAAGKESGTDAE